MREIKFRAWDKQSYEWMYAGLKNGTRSFPLTVSNPLSLCLDDRLGDKYENTVWCLNDDEVVWCQYTGLKDKNGVEIYEGDIVAYDLGFDDEKPENYKIVFDNKQCAYFMFPLNDKSRLRHFTYSAKNDCEVIGNIYENTELLNKG